MTPDAAFDTTLAVGNLVTARWTHSHGYYSAPAVIVKLNAKSLRVQLQRAVKAPSGGLWVNGHVLTLPRYTGDRWSFSNGVFPPEPADKCDSTCVGCAGNLTGKPRNYLGTIGRGPYCNPCADEISKVFYED